VPQRGPGAQPVVRESEGLAHTPTEAESFLLHKVANLCISSDVLWKYSIWILRAVIRVYEILCKWPSSSYSIQVITGYSLL